MRPAEAARLAAAAALRPAEAARLAAAAALRPAEAARLAEADLDAAAALDAALDAALAAEAAADAIREAMRLADRFIVRTTLRRCFLEPPLRLLCLAIYYSRTENKNRGKEILLNNELISTFIKPKNRVLGCRATNGNPKSFGKTKPEK